MNDDANRTFALFTEAVDLPDGERATFLDRACAGDQILRGKVEVLLKVHRRAGEFLQQPPNGLAVRGLPKMPVGEKPGDWIGRYKLLQQIGEGGCGVVFMAEQEEPVRRRVALKIIKPGMDTKSVIARFDAERQALALMDHPNIAKIFDAGATESGRPYFVMELIRGTRITEYCDQHSLTTEERLQLFIEVCQSVQHAHQKGVIHRDIKPSNILVTTTLEGAALPVVIDFGIAKATTNQRLTDKTLFTAFEMLIGTPAYMSPEQAALTNADVDTRTDIYSLGVLLYELLTGSTPFDSGALLKAGLDEIRRVIRDQEPVSPSTRLSKMTGADLTTVAEHRKSEAPKLIRAVTGDLDWIAMKALEKDRTRRYETASGLALDVRRFLAREAVLARPPSKLYRFQKIVLRNKLLFIGIGVIAMLLIISLIVVSASLARERQARREADNGKQKAQTEADKSQQITLFLEDMLQGVGPSVALGRDTTMLRDILDRTAERVGKAMTNQPAVEAELRSLLGRLYFRIGNYNRAEDMHRAALAICRDLFGPESPETAAALNDLGVALLAEGKLLEAEAVNNEALTVRRRLFHTDNADIATSLNNLANVYRHVGRLKEAESHTREALRIRRELFGKEDLEVADSLRNLCIILGDEGNWTESEAIAREVLAMRRKLLGPEHPWVASALTDLAWAVGAGTNLVEAETLEREALAMRQRLLGADHPDVAKSLYLLGDRMRQQGELSQALPILSAALSIQRKVLGEDNPVLLDTMRSLALTLDAEGKPDESEKIQREALAVWQKRGEGETQKALLALENLCRALITQKKFSDAEQSLNSALTPELSGKPTSANLLALRAELRSRRGLWQEAAGDAALASGYQPTRNELYPVVAALLAKTRNRAAYVQFCKRLLATSAETSNIYVADQVAKACLFLPTTETDLKVIGHLVDAALTRGAGDQAAIPFFQVCKGLYEYRQGHFAEAIEWAQKPLKTSSTSAHGHAYGILAMAYWRMEKKDEARQMLANGDKLAPAIMPVQIAEDPGNAWLAWLFARIQLDEAAALIRPQPTNTNSSNHP
jgi:eukaryotic-like serine/threonine-protein kinase